jgi:hypothetical protein
MRDFGSFNEAWKKLNSQPTKADINHSFVINWLSSSSYLRSAENEPRGKFNFYFFPHDFYFIFGEKAWKSLIKREIKITCWTTNKLFFLCCSCLLCVRARISLDTLLLPSLKKTLINDLHYHYFCYIFYFFSRCLRKFVQTRTLFQIKSFVFEALNEIFPSNSHLIPGEWRKTALENVALICFKCLWKNSFVPKCLKRQERRRRRFQFGLLVCNVWQMFLMNLNEVPQSN